MAEQPCTKVRGRHLAFVVVGLVALLYYLVHNFGYTVVLSSLGWVLVAFVVGVGLLVLWRYNSPARSELDRLGSDLALWGWGIGASFILAGLRERPDVIMSSVRASLWVSVTVIGILPVAYIACLRHSEAIRKLGYPRGLENVKDLQKVLRHPEGRPCFVMSLIIGFVPSFVLTVL